MSTPREDDTSKTTNNGEIDGRTARRDRNSDATIDALIELIEEGEMFPTMAEIADRSGVSHRSVFRYFADAEDLFWRAVIRAYQRYAPLSAIEHYGRGSLDQRVDALVAQRLRLYEAIAPVARAARMRPAVSEAFVKAFGSNMALLRPQLEVQFAPELEAFAGDELEHRILALDVLTSFEGYELLTYMQQRPKTVVADLWGTAVRALLR